MFKPLALARSAIPMLALFFMGTANSQPVQDLPYFTPSGCAPGSCYDFTVYTSTTASTVIPGTSLGYIEGFLSYGTPTGGSNPTATATLSGLYFTSTGIGTTGATISNWAPIVNLNLPVTVPDTVPGTTTTAASGIVGSTTTLYTGGVFAGRVTSNTDILFSANGSSYKLTLNGGSTSSSISVLNGGSWDLLPIGQNYYTSTASGQNTNLAGSNFFGGQIAPEMDAASALNVFALLACLALIYSKRKYFYPERLGNGVAIA